MIALPRDREYPLPIEEMEAAIERGQYTTATRMDGVLVIRDAHSGRIVGKKNDLPTRSVAAIKADIRVAVIQYMDEGGAEKMKAAFDKHLAQPLPQWQVIKLLLEYSVGSPQQEIGDTQADVVKHLIDRMTPQIATVSDVPLLEGEGRDVD